MAYFRENIEKLHGYVPGFQPGSTKVIKLNTNENPYPPSPKVLEAIAAVTPEQLRRYPDPLGTAFREAAAEVLGLEPGNILCTNGGDELLTLCFRAFCGPDRSVAYPGPTYSLYPVLAGIQNCEPVEVPFDEAGYFQLDEILIAGAGLVILCNPNAPTGLFVRPQRIADLAERLRGKSILLVDEAYVDFAEANCVPLVREHENLILLRSLSKGYSLAGLRFGFGIARPVLIEGLLKVKDSYNVNAISIAAATAAIRDQVTHHENVNKVRVERVRLIQALRELGFEVRESSTNFVLAKYDRLPAAQIHELLAGRDIYVRYFDLDGLRDKLRITVGTPEQNNGLIEALKKITGAKE